MSECPFTFNEETHTYRLNDGRAVPGHTRVLDQGGLVRYDHISADILERKSEIGREVHRTTKLYDDGVTFKKIDQRVEPYLQAWIDFRQSTKFVPILREYRGVYCIDTLHFGMTIDAFGFFSGQRGYICIEQKTCTVIMPHHGVQLAPQAAMIPDDKLQSPLARFMSRARVVVQLKPDGKFRTHYFTDRTDFEAFRAALYLTHWKMQHKKFYEDLGSPV